MYRINEIFLSLQGEGFWTGTPMVFVRFSGCNLHCPFCDTDHSAFREMTGEQLLKAVREAGKGCRRICLTGGEPSLQADGALIQVLHEAGYRLHIETNGTRPLPEGLDWITLSPKADVPALKGDGTVVLPEAHEVKLVFDGSLPPETIARWAAFPAAWHFLQPCDTGDPVRNAALLEQTLATIQAAPDSWRLSLQTHKLLGIR